MTDTLDQAKASRCYAEDTCTFDDACPFIISCRAVAIPGLAMARGEKPVISAGSFAVSGSFDVEWIDEAAVASFFAAVADAT